MHIPKGFDIEGHDTKDFVLQIYRNIYGQKKAGRVWNKYLVDKLINKLGFRQSKVDECVFYRGTTVYLLYTDDSILAGPDQSEIDTIIRELKDADLNITEEGDLQDFLGVNIEQQDDGSVLLTQPHLIDSILQDLQMDASTKTKSTPASSSQILFRHTDSHSFNRSFDYRSVIGKLNYLERASRPDISYNTSVCKILRGPQGGAWQDGPMACQVFGRHPR